MNASDGSSKTTWAQWKPVESLKDRRAAWSVDPSQLGKAPTPPSNRNWSAAVFPGVSSSPLPTGKLESVKEFWVQETTRRAVAIPAVHPPSNRVEVHLDEPITQREFAPPRGIIGLIPSACREVPPPKKYAD